MRDQELVAQARDGDGEAFRRLVEPYRHELQVHCTRTRGLAVAPENQSITLHRRRSHPLPAVVAAN
ncbi:hypothetical protein [Allorhizocola rhizosphaerae]|uniref:hypothetical protein n=1 Tax=Allorhizocola rhizosphaerae TaxID=1872709 RepID=UPI001B8ADFA7|nr:hypothetical protein [Allorhizocola rhizosphaerae]